MAGKEELDKWMGEVLAAKENQPETSWTVARLQLSYPSPDPSLETVTKDTVVAAGNCNAHVVESFVNEEIGRIELNTAFNDFEMRGSSHFFGDFEIVLQKGRRAEGRFWQKSLNSLFPLNGEWNVPFQVESRFGTLIPRPTDPPVMLRSAPPGEFSIPPIGSWFEKWEPISMVDINDPDGPTLVTVDNAMHVMLNPGNGPKVPPFYERR